MLRRVYIGEALDILRSGESAELKLWKQSNGEILIYRNCFLISVDYKCGTASVKLRVSGQIRRFNLCCLFAINGHEVYL